MSGLCGWVGGIGSSDSARNVIANMKAALRCARRDVDAEFIQTKSCSALAIAGASIECDAMEDGGLSVVATGLPIWLDPKYQSIASDTGTALALAKAWQDLGRNLIDVVDNISFALIDSNQAEALIAIDRMASRAMCFTEPEDGSLVFATMTDCLGVYPGVDTKVNAQAVYDLMYFTRIPAPETIYQNCYKLLPAQYLHFSHGATEVGRYWNMPYTDATRIDATAVSRELREAVSAATNRSRGAVAEDRVGAFLSGGVDSSTILGSLAACVDGPASCFTMGFDVDGYDGMSFARMAAAHFGANCHEYYVTADDVVDLISMLPKTYDEPFANTSVVPSYYCAKLAREHGVELLLAGDGGDELFAGNSRYGRQKILDLYTRIPRWIRNGMIEPGLEHAPFRDSITLFRKGRSYVEQANMAMPERMEAANYYSGRSASEMFDDDFAARVDIDGPIDLLREAYDRTSSESLLHRMMHVDLQVILADDDLRKVGRMCETAGVAVGFPLLDPHVVKVAAQIPAKQMMRGIQLRTFFKDAFKDFLPKSTLTKSKHGFGLPFGYWLREHGPLQEVAHAALFSLKDRGIYRVEFIDEVIQASRTGHASYHGELVWVLMMLELWLQEHQSVTLR